MSYTNETTHYGIPKPIGSDLTTPMDYNESAEAVDTALFGAVTTAGEANTTANNAKDAVTTLSGTVSAIDTRVTTVEGTQATQGTAISNLANTVGDNKQDLMDAICTIVEASATATVKHEVGQYFWYNDTLYKTTVLINIGDAIVPNTNCQTTNVTTELLGIESVDISQLETDVDNLKTDMLTVKTNIEKSITNTVIGTLTDDTDTTVQNDCILVVTYSTSGAQYGGVTITVNGVTVGAIGQIEPTNPHLSGTISYPLKSGDVVNVQHNTTYGTAGDSKLYALA